MESQPLTIVFPIIRSNFYRILGSTIDRAQQEGHRVILALLNNFEGDLKPTPENIPAPLRGCEVVLCSSLQALAEAVQQAQVVISMLGREAIFPAVEQRNQVLGPLWAVIFDCFHSTRRVHAFYDADLAFWPTAKYRDEAIVLAPEHQKLLWENARFVGWARSDVFVLAGRNEIRCSWNLKEEERIVLYIPEAYYLVHPPGVVTDWYRDVWSSENAWARFWKVWCRTRKWSEAWRAAQTQNGPPSDVGSDPEIL